MRFLASGWEGCIKTEMSPAECRGRLREAVPEGWNIISNPPLFGEIGDMDGSLRRGGLSAQTMQPRLRFRIQAHGTGSYIIYEARSPVIWLIPIAVIWVSIFSLQALLLPQDGDAPQAGLAALVLTILVVILLPLGQLHARHDGAFLTDFVARTVNGRIVT